MPMLQQTTGEVRLADHKRRHQRAGVAVLTAIPTNSRRIPSRTALNIASAGNPNYCLLTNWGSSGECRLSEGASVILTTSIAVQKGFPETAVYSATKAAVRSLARTLAAELVDKNIRVNALAPGSIDTPIFENLGMSEDDARKTKAYFESIIPMKRLGEPEEVAKPALMLASDESSFMTGFELVVDGGVTEL